MLCYVCGRRGSDDRLGGDGPDGDCYAESAGSPPFPPTATNPFLSPRLTRTRMTQDVGRNG